MTERSSNAYSRRKSMIKLTGKASDILYDYVEGLYTKEFDDDGNVLFVEKETGKEYAIDDDVKYYLELMEECD